MAEAVVLVGVIGGPFGVKGWVRVNSYTEPPANLLAYRPWQVQRDDRWQVPDVEAEAHGTGLVVRIEGATDRDAAVAWRGARIGVDASVLPSPAQDEYYWRDLTERRVVTVDGNCLGRVERLFSTPAHDVIVVAGEDGERLIPFVRDVVLAVESDGGRIVVAWDPEWR